MLKWRRSLAALLLVLILFDAFALGLLWQRKRQAKNKIKFKNELPGIEVVWKDKKGFSQLLEKINFWQKGVLLYGQHQRVKPKQRRGSGDHRQWFEHYFGVPQLRREGIQSPNETDQSGRGAQLPAADTVSVRALGMHH